MSTEHDNQNTRFLSMLAATAEKRTLRIGMDYVNKALWYGVEIGGKTYFLHTGWHVTEGNQLPNNITVAEGSVLGSPISYEGMTRYVKGSKVQGAKLIEELTQFIGSHAKFEVDTIPAVLAHWLVAGYAHMVFANFPYLSITSAQPGCGKSRVLELLSEVGFRAKPLILNPTPAVLYRSLHDSAQVMLIDEFEHSTDETKRTLTQVLNSGFQRGAVVPRCVGENNEIKYFQSYGPKAFAGLSRIPDTLRTRSIPILMMPKRPEDGIQPFHPAQEEMKTQRWRDDAAIFALCNAPDLAAAATDRDQLGIPDSLQDREIDYMTPLFATAMVAGSDLEALRSFCQTLVETRQARAAQGSASRAAKALLDWFPEGESEARIFLSDAARLFQECDALEEAEERDAGNLLRNMGLDVRQMRIGGSNRKGLILTREDVTNLAERFEPEAQPPAAELEKAA